MGDDLVQSYPYLEIGVDISVNNERLSEFKCLTLLETR